LDNGSPTVVILVLRAFGPVTDMVKIAIFSTNLMANLIIGASLGLSTLLQNDSKLFHVGTLAGQVFG